MKPDKTKKPAVPPTGSSKRKGQQKMQAAIYHENTNSTATILAELQNSFQNLTAVLGVIHLTVKATADDKALSLCQEMEVVAMLLVQRIRTELNVPY